MAVPGFLAENRYRSFPFLEQTVGWPPSGPTTILNVPVSAVVDCGFLIGPPGRYNYTTHVVRLGRVQRTGTLFLFEFVSDAPGLVNHPLRFYRDLSDPEYTSSFASVTNVPDLGSSGSSGSSLSSSSSLAPLECDVLIWEGYLTTGSLEDLAALVPDGTELLGAAGQGVVEPALVQNLSDGYVTGISVANEDRTRATAPEGCPEYVWPFPLQDIYVKRRCMTGPILLDAGYNVFLRQGDGEVTIFPAPGAGQGEPCSEIPLTSSESGPDDPRNLAGGPWCSDVLRSINGVGGRILQIAGGRGVSVVPDPDNHRIVVDIDLRGVPARWFGSLT